MKRVVRGLEHRVRVLAQRRPTATVFPVLAAAATTLAVLLVLLRRQFVSKARAAVLLGQYPNLGSADKSGEYTDTGSSNPFT